MKVFVSWSGELSQKYAKALKEWLEQCIQSVEVFFSSEDIEKGENWQIKISGELQDTNYGIVCLTPENIDAPWIHFEAGALSKLLDSRVMVLAININFSDIKGPLKAFQATKFEQDDLYKLLKAINTTQEKPLSEEKLRNSFDAFWPQFKSKIEEIKNDSANEVEDKKASKVNVSGTVDEILQLVRSQNALINSPEKLLPVEYLEYVFRKNERSNDADRILEEVYSFSEFLVRKYGSMLRQDYTFFFENYYLMVKNISSDNPIWRRRFYALFSRYKKESRTDETIVEDEKELGALK
ncbi:MAG: toll/interleukin-1 receptor domain-containing protein [Clostridia bacterium]|nr:toll/interleukin-1 receptor domain-containing protein [Clostridia bacterium]